MTNEQMMLPYPIRDALVPNGASCDRICVTV